MRISVLLVSLVFAFTMDGLPSHAHAAPAPTKSSSLTTPTPQKTTQRNTAQVSEGNVQKSTQNPDHVPNQIWLLEGVSAGVAALGFVGLAIGYGNFSRRDQLVSKAENGEKADATEVKLTQDAGNVMTIVGWVFVAAGVVGMVYGGYRIITHKPPSNAPPAELVQQKSPASPTRVGVLFRSEF